jgi:type VI secretion system TssD-like protein
MSFLAKLYFEEFNDDEGLNVLECSYEFNVATDRSGKRREHPTGGQISLLIESSQKVDFLEWMISGESKDGKIIFYKRDMMASERKVVFHRADCIHYSEEFVADGNFPRKTRIIIAPFIITVDDTKFQTWYE